MDTCSTMFIAALFIIARSWKQPRCPSIEERIRKMWYIYTVENYEAEKNNDIMKFAGKWMELENVILSEVTQTQKDKHDHDVALCYLSNAVCATMSPTMMMYYTYESLSEQQAIGHLALH
ncbi:hypothetical protein STEG23_036827 [Scotinomys teguina]